VFPRLGRPGVSKSIDAARLDRIAGEVVAERLEPTVDARGAPGRVLRRHAYHSAARSALVLGRAGVEVVDDRLLLAVTQLAKRSTTKACGGGSESTAQRD
jgi:hypothetical protein